MDRDSLLRSLERRGIEDPRVLAALARVPRDEFVEPQDRGAAWADRALPLTEGQSISQPYVVALMTQALELGPDSRVLEVGTGSGYQAAVLAACAGEVYTIEVRPALARSASARLAALGFRVHSRIGDGAAGWPEAAPFDAIVLTAGAPEVPAVLFDQLAPGGRLIAPIGDGDQDLVLFRRGADGTSWERSVLLPVRFVPLVSPAP